jgi:hypothetical protein
MQFLDFSTVLFYGLRPNRMKWEKTKTAHLLKNSDSGTYYARLYRDGKEVWKSLKTQVYSVAAGTPFLV